MTPLDDWRLMWSSRFGSFSLNCSGNARAWWPCWKARVKCRSDKRTKSMGMMLAGLLKLAMLGKGTARRLLF